MSGCRLVCLIEEFMRTMATIPAISDSTKVFPATAPERTSQYGGVVRLVGGESLGFGEQGVESPGQSDAVHDLSRSQQCPLDVGSGAGAGVVPQREPFIGKPETTSVDRVKPGSRTLCTCACDTVAPRA